MNFVESNNSQHVDVSSRGPEAELEEQEVEDPEVLARSFTMYKIGEKNGFKMIFCSQLVSLECAIVFVRKHRMVFVPNFVTDSSNQVN